MSNSLSTPGVKSNGNRDQRALSSKEARQYKAIAARANYLCQDRAGGQGFVQVNVQSYAGRLDGIQEIGKVFDREDQGDNQVQLSEGGEERDNMDGH